MDFHEGTEGPSDAQSHEHVSLAPALAHFCSPPLWAVFVELFPFPSRPSSYLRVLESIKDNITTEELLPRIAQLDLTRPTAAPGAAAAAVAGGAGGGARPGPGSVSEAKKQRTSSS